MDDRKVVAAQLDREPRSVVDVVTRCHLDLPVVIAVPPHLDDGTPFPTRFWLTCPLASRRIGRLEAAGGVREMDRRIADEPDFAAAYRTAMHAYAAERDALVEPGSYPHDPSGGVGGSVSGVKCLHAHYAHHAAGRDNPIGAVFAQDVEPLNCAMACVAETEAGVERSTDWREPVQ
jgi:hypothetical protein